MNTSQQPVALRLADKYEVHGFLGDQRYAKDYWCSQAAAELRRLYDRVTELEAEASDNARIIGASAETELALRAQVENLERKLLAGWEITEEMHMAAVKVLRRASGVDGLPQRMVDAMLLAAPLPSVPTQLDDIDVTDMPQAFDLKVQQ